MKPRGLFCLFTIRDILGIHFPFTMISLRFSCEIS
jgi:hypothetical protein